MEPHTFVVEPHTLTGHTLTDILEGHYLPTTLFNDNQEWFDLTNYGIIL